MSAVGAADRCAVHPDQPAQLVCERCGNFACVACVPFNAPLDGPEVCMACAGRTRRGASWLSVVAALGGFAGFACAPLGPAAVMLGAIDLVRGHHEGQKDASLKLDAIGIVLGLIGTAVWLYAVYRILSGAPLAAEDPGW